MQHDDTGEFFAGTRTDGSGAGMPSALPATRVRPLTRRRHVRVPGATAAAVERLAWTGADEADDGVTAVSVVPSGKLGPRVTRPAPAGADLQALLGAEELGCRPGRHREHSGAWHLLRRVPGWRPSSPAWDDDADGEHGPEDPAENTADDACENAPEDAPEDARESGPDVPAVPALDVVPGVDLVPAGLVPAALAPAAPTPADVGPAALVPTEFDTDPVPVDLPFELPPVREAAVHAVPQQPSAPAAEAPAQPEDAAKAALEAEIAAAADLSIPAQREAPPVPWYRQRRRRSPAPSLRAEIQAAGVLFQQAQGQPEIARIAAEQAARLVTADVSALVLRAVEGPRVLWLHPGGPDAADLWGPATLNALLGVGQPVRRVVEGDPLAGGAATALLAVPVPSGGSIAGTLLVRRHQPRPFTATEQDVLSRVARMTGAALLSTTRRTAFERGELDDVTGLPGGRRLSGDVAAAVRTADRAGMPVTVLAAHVLGLSRLRTELGSPAADQVLGELTRAFAGVLRVGDVAYRIGEDELALLLPATDGAGVPVIRERLEGITAEVVAALDLPGSPRQLALRTANVPLEAVRAGGDAVDAVTRALELDRQKVRWTKGTRPLSS